METIDILNREEFVNNVFNIIERLAGEKKKCAFAIDGEWGSGKTFVLNMLEAKLNEPNEEVEQKYFVIRYNSWEFDYYEEPLMAIVFAMIDSIEQQTKLFPDSEKKSRFLSTLKFIALSLAQKANEVVKDKTGIDAYQVIKDLHDSSNQGAKEYNEKHEYDIYFKFNAVLKNLKKVLSDISENYTIIFLIDELDRCLPEYTIKVLERLHHTFEDISNLQAIMLVDKMQLEQTVKKIYGDAVNVSGYLTKFIDFTINLPIGDIDQEKFDELFKEYVSSFDYKSFTIDGTLQEFLNELFKYSNIRKRIKIIEKAKLVHSLMNEKELRLPIDFLALELFLTTVSFIHNDLSTELKREIKTFRDIIPNTKSTGKELSDLYEKVFNGTTKQGQSRYIGPNNERAFSIINTLDIWGSLFVALIKQYNYCGEEYRFDSYNYFYRYSIENHIKQFLSYSKKFTDILKLMS